MDDWIRRSDAIRLAEQGQIQGFLWQFEQLVKLPSAQPERKKGEWIDTNEADEWYGDLYRCSVCGGVMIEKTDYCPDCGSYNGGKNEV